MSILAETNKYDTVITLITAVIAPCILLLLAWLIRKIDQVGKTNTNQHTDNLVSLQSIDESLKGLKTANSKEHKAMKKSVTELKDGVKSHLEWHKSNGDGDGGVQ